MERGHRGRGCAWFVGVVGCALAAVVGGAASGQDVQDPDAEGEDARPRFRRGDVNCNGIVTLVDATELAADLFLNLPIRCDCMDARDTNDDGAVLIEDVVFLLQVLTLGSTEPPAPGRWDCGPDPTRDDLDCSGYPRVRCGEPMYKRGDVNCDGCVDTDDAILLRAHLFENEPLPCDCFDARDANGDGDVGTSDVVFLLRFSEENGPPPPSPGPFLCGSSSPAETRCNDYPREACFTGCANQLPGDCNQDGELDISDPVCLLNYLFLGRPERLPCGNGHHSHAGNTGLLSWRGNGQELEMADALGMFRYMFGGGPPHPLGTQCVFIESCPTSGACP